jgi:NAD(P)-dependent dehydrogenase (short-subunit alcohol dehydrogenase family)
VCHSFEDSGERCDVLINNAGVLLSERSETSEGIETTFATNTLGERAPPRQAGLCVQL